MEHTLKPKSILLKLDGVSLEKKLNPEKNLSYSQLPKRISLLKKYLPIYFSVLYTYIHIYVILKNIQNGKYFCFIFFKANYNFLNRNMYLVT